MPSVPALCKDISREELKQYLKEYSTESGQKLERGRRPILVGGRVRALDSVEGRECRFGAVQRLESPVGHALAGSRAARTQRAPRYKPARGGRWEPIHRGLTGIFSLRCAAWE